MEYLTRKKKLYKYWLSLFGLALFFLGLFVWYYVRRSLPPMDGKLELKNLKAEVSVIRDNFGIPHIKAQNRLDAFRSLGYILASERLFQMEMQRRVANGELSEILGEKFISTDKLFRSIGLRSSMQKMLEQKIQNKTLDLSMWNEVEAFYDGINQFQQTGKLPLEFTLLHITPRPFHPLDGYAFTGLMSFSFGVATNEDPLMTKIRARLGKDLTDELRNELTPYEEKIKEKEKEDLKKKTGRVVFQKLFPVDEVITQLTSGFSVFEGSNGWLIGPSKSASSYPILSNDPHISYSNPGIWFEAHLKTPDFESYGHFLPLVPFPVLSHNHQYGWGLTMSLIDDMDLYKEQLDQSSRTYAFKGSRIPYNERLEVIKVKDQAPQKIIVMETHHGPILDHVFLDQDQKSLALKWAFHQNENDPFFALYKMGTAKNMTEFKAAVALGRAPGLNVLYADKTNIGWWIFGEMAKKANHESSDFILDGASGLDEYEGVLKFDEKPHLENPASNIILSANARPEGNPAPPANLRGDWQPNDRYKTLQVILNQKSKWSVEEIKELQTLNMNLENKLILNALLEAVDFDNLWKKERYKEYFEILRSWNFISDTKEIAPSLYYSWCREVLKLLLSKDLSANELEAFSKLPNGWNFMKRVVQNGESPWWKKYDRKKLITLAFNNAVESLRQRLGDDHRNWTWGHLHTVEFVHPIGRKKPLDKIFNIGPIEIGGGGHEVNNQRPVGLSEGFKVIVGPSTRRIIDFKDPSVSYGILPTGNSGHLLSPFYKDQLPLFVKGEYRHQWLNDADIKANVSHELTLSPAR